MTRDDPELGIEKFCRRCGEWWPLDPEFWFWTLKRGRRVPHCWCRACWCEYNATQQRARKMGAA